MTNQYENGVWLLWTSMNQPMKYLIILFIIWGCTQKTNYDILYESGSKAFLKVSIESLPKDTLYVEAYTSLLIPAKRSESQTLAITHPGTYHLSLEIDRPHVIWFSIDKSRQQIVAYPSDTSFLKISIDKGEPVITFHGKGADINEYLAAKKRALGYYDIRMPFNKNLSSKSTYNSLKTETNKIAMEALEFLDRYSKENKFDDWFYDYEKSQIIYRSAGFNATIPGYNKLFNTFEDSLPSNYFDFLDSLKINNKSSLLSEGYFSFLNTYFFNKIQDEEIEKLSGSTRGLAITKAMQPLWEKELQEDAKEIFRLSHYTSLLRALSDSVQFDSVVKAQNIPSELVNTFNRARSLDGEVLAIGDTIPTFYLTDMRDSLASLKNFSTKVVYINFWATWCGPCIKNFPELNNMINSYQDESKLVFLNICLASEKEKWISIVKQYKLKGINLYANENWESKLRTAFSIRGIPHYALLGSQHILFENNTLKAPEIRRRIDQLLINEELKK